MQHQPLPNDWQRFYDELGENAATIGLFPLGPRGEQPVFLINAPASGPVPLQPALLVALEWHQDLDRQVVRFLLMMREASGMAAPELNVYEHRGIYRIAVADVQAMLKFEVFLNPTAHEDRLILAKLIDVPGLYVSFVQHNAVLWGKQFPWQDSFREALRRILDETRESPMSDPAAWETAKAQVMREFPL